MTIRDLYDFATERAFAMDPRGEPALRQHLADLQREYDGLTGLAEYRNGGLLVDLGVIRSREAMDPCVRHEVLSELVVEWRALTVALMDPLVALVGTRLGLASAFSMPQMLQGGTWSAGRKIAQALRPPDGPPPILIAADGTVF